MTTFARLAALIALAFTSSLSSTAAWSSDIARAARIGLIPPFEVFTVLRSMNLEPAGSPMLRGAVYVVRAFDDDDIPVRVTVDARSGRVLTVTDIAQGDDFSTPGRMGALPMPPDDLPAQPEYRQDYPPEYRPGYGARSAPGQAARPAPPTEPAPGVAAAPPRTKKPAVATRTPTPRARPAETASTGAPATTGAIRDSSKPGKSIPAPVARSAAKAASSSGSSAASPAAAAAPASPPAAAPATEAPPAPKTETPMVPVAPLE
jgi:hypothetical protein